MLELILISIVLVALFSFVANFKDKDNKRFLVCIKILSFIFAIFYFCRLITVIDKFDYYFEYTDKEFIFGKAEFIELTYTRLLTNAGIMAILISPWFKKKALNNLVCFLFPLVFLLNMIEYELNVIAVLGNVNAFEWNHFTALYAIEIVLGFTYCVSCLINRIIHKDLYKKVDHEFIYTIITLLFLAVVGMSWGSIGNIFGYSNHTAEGFNIYHIKRLLLTIVYIVGLFIYLRNKDENHKWYILTTITVGLVRIFFDYYDAPIRITQLPLHLCHFGCMCLLLICLTHNKKIFYFTFFINILGASFALLAPTETTSLTACNVVHTWYEHMSIVALSANMLCLNLFPRPKFKDFLAAIGIYTLYYALVLYVNMRYWESGITYFFMNSNDDVIDIVKNIIPESLFGDVGRFFATLKNEENILYFQVGKETWRIYPIYNTLLYFGYMVIILFTWIGVKALQDMADNHYLMHRIRIEKGIKMFNLDKLTHKKKNVEPMYPQDKGCVRISHFTKIYSGQNNKSVDDFSLTIKGGEVYGFLGHNGAGKSTTIKSLVGIQTITSGTISVCGFDIEKQAVEAKLNIGYVSDNHAVYEQLTGREYINYVANLYLVPKKEREERFNKYVKMFNLEDAIDREIKGYSHGMKQKIVVIASLMHDPKVWVLDEPLTGLDPTSSFQIKECMRDHANRGNIVFFSSHVIEVVEKICDKICIIGHGKLIGEWTIKDLNKSGESLEGLYMKYVAQQNLNIEANNKKADLTTKEGR